MNLPEFTWIYLNLPLGFTWVHLVDLRDVRDLISENEGKFCGKGGFWGVYSDIYYVPRSYGSNKDHKRMMVDPNLPEFTWFTRIYHNLPELSWIYLNLQEFTGIYRNLPESTGNYLNFLNLPDFAWIFLDLPKFTSIYLNLPILPELTWFEFTWMFM